MKHKIWQKIFALTTAIVLIFNSVSPLFLVAYAEELTPTPEVTQEVTPTPEDPTPTIDSTQPTETVTPTPTIDSTQPTETVTPTPDQVEATPTPEDTTEISATSTPANDSSPPSENSSSSNSPADESDNNSTPTETPTVLPTPTPEPLTGEEELNLVIIENVAAPAIDLSATVAEGSAVLKTDKDDYAPTDTALIMGSKLLPNTEYLLKIWSDDEPPTGISVQVTSDENGDFAYAYQLDGTYRPNYNAELIDLIGAVVASTTFTDSPAAGCYNDSGGVNDEPGQKDLTKACVNYAGLPTNIAVSWNWDEINGSGNNSYDACSLYDTDSDGFVNYSVCVTLKGSPLSQVVDSPRIYSCSNTKIDRCAGATLIIGPYTTSCSASQQNSDPFSGGDVYPQDSVASCIIALGEVGGITSRLLDVCSYPSQEPNSDPSDCIFASTANQTGFLEVKKVLIPTNDIGLFNLQIDATTFAVDVGNNGTTGEKIVETGDRTVGEIAGTGTNLSNYSSAIVCRNNNGAGSIVAQSTNSGPLTVNISNNADIVCIITNTRINNGSITVVKDAQPNDAQDFAFTATGAGLSPFSLDDDSDPTFSNTKVFSNLAAGTYSVSEGAVTDWTQTSATCDDGSPVSAISLQEGENVTCTFTNTKQATLTVNKVLSPSDDPGKFNLQIDGNTTGTGANVGNNGTTGAVVVTTASHTVSETAGTATTLSDYTSVIGGDCAANGTVILAAGENKTCTITNTLKPIHLTLVKTITNDNGGTAAAADWTLDAAGPTHISGATGTGNVTNAVVGAGTYTLSENSGPSGYTASTYSCVKNAGGAVVNNSITLAPGDDVTCTITNDDNQPKLTVTKIVNGGTASVSAFPLFVGTTSVESGVQNGFDADPYIISETQQKGYTQTSIAGDCDRNGNVTLAVGDVKACTITNTRDTGSVKVNKLADTDGNGTFESLNPGTFTWSLDGSGTNTMGSTVNNIETGSHDIDENTVAGYKFIGWFLGHPGDNEYSCENLPKYSTSLLPLSIDVGKDDVMQINLCNQMQNPSFTISKANNAIGNQSPGGNVIYQITLTVNDADASNITVTDLLPKGFVYQGGSWSVDLSGNPLVVPEPTYASPGTWILGNAQIGDVFTLKYTAKIDGGQQVGTYYDNAWAQGTPVNDSSNQILAVAVAPGIVNTNFVGTEVNVVNGNQGGPEYETTITEEVLGASIYLPATGEHTFWVIIATLMLGLGTGTLITGLRIKKKHVE